MDSKMSSKISSDRNYFDLTGQVALVTGCSSGIGIQMAKALASAGANIVAVARRVDRLEAVAKEIAEEFGVKALPVHCDVRDTASVESAVDAALEEFGRLDIVINNAGTGSFGPAEDLTDEQFDTEVDIDLYGIFRVSRAAAKKAMIRPGTGASSMWPPCTGWSAPMSRAWPPTTRPRAAPSTSRAPWAPSGRSTASPSTPCVPATSTPS